MRKEYDFSKGIRASTVFGPRSRRSRSQERRGWVTGVAREARMTPMQVREINRRVADLDDPVRYLLASRMTPRFVLYYDLSDDTYILNDPQQATLFKRREVAESVRRLLGGRIKVIRCITKRRNGRRVPVLPKLRRGRKNAL